MSTQVKGEGRSAKLKGFTGPLMAMLWAFLGLRRKRDFEEDSQSLKPLQVIVVGLIGGFVFVLGLMLLVNWIV